MKYFSLALFILALILMVFTSAHAGAAADRDGSGAAFDYSAFGRIPVLHEGRIKPLESFAAVELARFSAGRSKHDPLPWLAQALFDPAAALAVPVLAVTDKALAERLNLPMRKNRLYSLAELMSGLAATQEQAMKLALDERDSLTTEQKALVALHENALAFDQLLQSMSLFLPMAGEIPDGLAVQADIFAPHPTYLELRSQERALMAMVADMIKRRGEDPAQYNAAESNLATLALEFRQRQELGARNILLRVIPAAWGGGDEWLTPWALLLQGQAGPASAPLMTHWQDMAKAYRAGDAGLWLEAAAGARKTILTGDAGSGLSRSLSAEELYNALSPFRSAVALYIAAALGFGFYFWRGGRTVYRCAVAAGAAGALMQGCGIVLRVAILNRPPVGSLYESLLFVSLIVVIAALFIERGRRDGLALSSGVAAALLTLFMSPLIAPDGDDLEMLVAVLNTGFWLATHVLCITAGYGVCLLTAALAHVALARPPDNRGLDRSLYLLSLISLLLTAVGTVLGGIWADQSWGRFWGWDPKENGALLIVLWLIWLHHGRMGAHLSQTAFTAGLAFLSVIVALSWIGVNLLNVGLHSYGFTSGLAAGLAVFVSVEIVVIAFLCWRARQRMRKTPA